MSFYKKYFEFPISHRDRPWAPHIVCASCYTALNRWNNAVAKVTPMPFKTPMIWREPSSHDDCYFCLTNVTGFNSENSDEIKYADFRRVTKPVIYGPHDKFPISPLMKEKEESNEVAYIFNEGEETDDEVSNPILFIQAALNDLVRDLNLPKDKSQLIGSRLKDRNLLAPETTFSWYRHRETKLVEFFSEGKDYVYCSNIYGLIEKSGLTYDSNNWRLFLDSSKRSFKAVLLHNTNQNAPITIGHSVCLNESYENVQTILNAVEYNHHNWKVC